MARSCSEECPRVGSTGVDAFAGWIDVTMAVVGTGRAGEGTSGSDLVEVDTTCWPELLAVEVPG